MVQISMTLNELEDHFCSCNRQNTSHGPSASAELLVEDVLISHDTS